MRVRTVWTWGVPIVALLVVAACARDSNPTAVSSLPPNVDQKDEVSEGKEAPESTPVEEFSCTNVEMVRARFSQPGYVEHNKVGALCVFPGYSRG